METDIEVKYKTDYPYGAFAGKGPEWNRECAKEEGKIREYLQPRLPAGVRFSNFHVHYHPDKYDPNIVALHIHVHKTVEDLDEAKDIALRLAETIKPSKIEAAMAKEGD